MYHSLIINMMYRYPVVVKISPKQLAECLTGTNYWSHCNTTKTSPKKTEMIRISSLLLTVCLLFEGIAANSISRQLQLNEKWWAIGDPDFNYDDSQFSFKWTVSDYIADGNAAYAVYDGTKCKEGNKDITESMNNYRDIATGAFLQNLGLQPDSATPYDPLNPNRGDGFRDMRLFLDVQPTLANTDLLYYESDNQNRAVVDFCVRFSLYNIDHRDEDAIEVNFQETM